MKHIFLFAFASLLFVGCSKKEEPPLDLSQWTTRTVYFATATLEKNGQQVRVMFDLDYTPMMSVLITADLRSALHLSTNETDPQFFDQVRAGNPYYDVIVDWSCSNFGFHFGEGINETWGVRDVMNFDRQERITGQHIDMVIGYYTFKQMVNTNLSQLPIDLTLTVPYD